MALLPNLFRHFKTITLAVCSLAIVTSAFAARPTIGNLPDPDPSFNDDVATSQTIFTGVTLGDTDVGAMLTMTVTYPTVYGAFDAAGFTSAPSGNNTVITYAAQTPAAAQADLQALAFNPTANAVAPGDNTVTFTILINDGTGGATAARSAGVDVDITSVNDDPLLSVPATASVNDDDPITLFATATISDPDVVSSSNSNTPVTVTITYDSTKGSFTTLSGFDGSTAGTATFSGTETAAQSNIRNMVFTPEPNETQWGTNGTLVFTVALSDSVNSVSPSPTTTLTIVPQNDIPDIQNVAIQASPVTMNDNATSSIFSAVTIVDPDKNETLNVTITYDDAKGSFTPTSSFTKSVNTGTATLTLTPGQTTSAAQGLVQALVFTPTPNQVIVGSAEELIFTIAAADTTPTPTTSSADANPNADRSYVSVTSINDVPVFDTTNVDTSLNLSVGSSSGFARRVGVSDLDIDAMSGTAGGDGDGSTNDRFTATIVLAKTTGLGSSYGSLTDSNFTLTSTANTYTYTADLTSVENQLQAMRYEAPSVAGTFTATVTVTDTDAGTSADLVFTFTVSEPDPGISGLQIGQEVFDNSSLLPFSTGVFTRFGGNDATITISLDDDTKGFFDILGGPSGFVKIGDDYVMTGNAVDATQAFQNLRFNPTKNLIIGDADDVTFTISAQGVSQTNTDTLVVAIKAVNDAPVIASDAPVLRINDDEPVKPFETLFLSDVDEAGGQDLTVDISFIGQDTENGFTDLPGGGRISITDADYTALGITRTGVTDWTGLVTETANVFIRDTEDTPSNLPSATNLADVTYYTYQFSGTPDEVNKILTALTFTPTVDKNGVGERETIRFTVLLRDGLPAGFKGGAAQVSDVEVITLTVNGAPVISGIPPLSQQPFSVAGALNNSNKTESSPFAGISVSDTEVGDLEITITLDDHEKGTLAENAGEFTRISDGVYRMTDTQANINAALIALTYELDDSYAFSLDAPGATTFTIQVKDSLPSGNTVSKGYSIVVRASTVAHIVTSTEDYADGDEPIAGSLRLAIERASSGDFIVFEFPVDGYSATIHLLRVLEIDKNLTIVGARPQNLTISGDSNGDGDPNVQLFSVIDGARLVLDQLTLKDGFAASYGGAVAVDEGGSLYARYCSFEENVAEQFGGAIDVFLGELTVDQCLFYKNEVSGSTAQAGGAISIYTTGPNSSIRNSTFVENLQLNGGAFGGGAIFAQNSDLAEFFDLLVEHCSFKDNSDAALSGSAILSASFGSEVLVRNNIFEDQEGRVLDVLGGGAFTSEGGNIATDTTETTYTLGGSPQNVVLLNNSNDKVNNASVLGALADNGGPTQTCLVSDTNALDSQVLAISPTDQRGAWRVLPDRGAYEANQFKRLNINEIYFGDSTQIQFIEFYNPRESGPLDLVGKKLYVNGSLIHTFTAANDSVAAGQGFALDADEWSINNPPTGSSPNYLLNKESGTITLEDTDGDILLVVDYVGNFNDLPSIAGIDSIDLNGGVAPQSITVSNLLETQIDLTGAKLYLDYIAGTSVEADAVYTFPASSTISPQSATGGGIPPKTRSVTNTDMGELLDSAGGSITLISSTGNIIFDFEYAVDSTDPSVGLNALDVYDQSITRYPDFEGPLLPHRRVVEQVSGQPVTPGENLSSKDKDVTGASLDGGNAPPIAIADPEGYVVFADQTIEIDVLNNDIEFDRVDYLRISELMDVTASQADSSDTRLSSAPLTIDLDVPVSLTDSITDIDIDIKVTGAVTAEKITYDPTVSSTAIGLALGEERTDIRAYSILDYKLADNLAYALPRGDSADVDDNVTKATNYYVVTIVGINEAPDAVDDGVIATDENQAVRIMLDDDLIASLTGPSPTLDFGDLPANYGDFNEDGSPAVFLPTIHSASLLDNDDDVDSDDSNDTLEIINVHTEVATVDQVVTVSARGALVTLDIRTEREESSIVYDPRSSPELNALQSGETLSDSFFYTVRDVHGATDVAEVTFTITGKNDQPTANDDANFFVTQNKALTIDGADLLANDEDPDQDNDAGSLDDELIVESVSATSVGGATITLANGEIIYDPTGIDFYNAMARNEVYLDEFTYTASDRDGAETSSEFATSTATVFVEFTGINDTPTADDDTLAVDENQTATITEEFGLIYGADGPLDLVLGDNDIDVDANDPNDLIWVIPQREITTPILNAAFQIETDGSYSYDANSPEIESLAEGVTQVEVFPYILTDNSRMNAGADNFKLVVNSAQVTLPVLANDDVAGSKPADILGYVVDPNDSDRVIVEVDNHALREGKLIQIQGHEGATAEYNGVYAVEVIDRDHFGVDAAFVDEVADDLGTWRPWFKITAFTSPSESSTVSISEDQQSVLYLPAVGFSGEETFKYTIEDGSGGQDVAIVSMSIIKAPLNSSIVANNDSFEVYSDQDPVLLNVLENDSTLPALGSDLTIIDVEAATVNTTRVLEISGDGKSIQYASPDGASSDSFTYTVSGGGVSTKTATATITVTAPAEFMSDDLEADHFTVVVGSDGNLLDVLANDLTLPNYPVTLELSNLDDAGISGVASISSGVISYNAPDVAGVDDFDYILEDELGNLVTKTVIVTTVEDTSNFYAVEDTYIVWAGGPEIILPVLVNDVATGSNGTDLVITNVGLFGDAPDAADRVSYDTGSIRYTPPETAGSEDFNYEIGDGTAEHREAQIRILVVDAYPVLDPVDDVFSVARDAVDVNLDVLINDDAYPLLGWERTITGVSAVSGEGVVEVTGGSSITYTPAPGFFGRETFTYTVKDAFDVEGTATVTVNVGSLITGPDAYIVLEGSADNRFPVLLNDDWINRYSEDYVITAVSTPTNGGVASLVSIPLEVEEGEDPAFDYQLNYTAPAFAGVDTFTYTVENNTGGTLTETVTVEMIDDLSDRALANLTVTVTGVNDAPVIGGTEDDSITDKESAFPFDTVTLSDVDVAGAEIQTAKVSFDSTLGTITIAANGSSVNSATVSDTITYTIVGTPSQVQAALRSIEFTPFENLEPPIYYDVVFTLSITDGYIATPIVDLTTVTVLAINDAPDPVDDGLYTTPENQVIRILADPVSTLPNSPFDFGDLDPDFHAVNGVGQTVTLLPVLQTVNLLVNDIDVDIDDDETTIELINVHQTDFGVDQITATSALGATVVLDIRALRAETNILYDPRGSATLNALPFGESLTDSFYYTVVDQHGAKGIAKVSITVTGVNDVPTAQNDGGYEVGEDGTILLGADDILSNDTDPDQGSGIDPVDDDAPIISNVPATSDLGANLTWNLGDDDIIYDPTGVLVFESLSRNEFIEDSITYTISDENGGFSMATIMLQIEGFNDAPVAADDLLELDENVTTEIVAGARSSNDGSYAAGLLSNDTEIDFNASTPDDDHWVIPQREVTTPLGAALYIETDGSYRYDANSRLIDSLIEDVIAEEVFPYIVTDNFRTSTSPDSFKVLTDSTDVVLPVLSNDDVAGSVPVAVLGYTEDLADTDRVIIESANHELRDGLLVKIQSYSGTGAYNGVYPITVVDRNHFSVESSYVDDPAGTRGTWRPWFNITALGETDQEGVVTISADAQTILYTPKVGFYGSESFQYTIEDGVGGQDVTLVEITVLQDPLNNVLSASDDRFQIGKGESAVEVDVLVNDNILPESGSAYTITGVAAVAASGTLDIISGGSALSYTPPSDSFDGVESFTYTISGGGSSSAQATVTFNVIDREYYLDGSDDDFVVVQDSSANLLDVAANDASRPSFPVSFEVVAVSTPSAGGAASVDNGQVSYTPLASYTGLDSFTYTIRDASGGNITKTVDVQVVPNVDQFYASDDHYIIVAGSGEHDLAVMFNDAATGANSSNLSIVNLGLDSQAPPAVERVIFTSSLVKYTVPATVPLGGKEVFNYEITDGTDQRREAVITVTIVDQLPTLPNALDDNYHVAKNSSAHSLDVMLNDLPLPDAGWAWTITSADTVASQGGSIVVDGGTSVTYSPATGFYGIESFDYTITDIFGDTATATVTIAVGLQLTEPDHYVVLENSSANDFPVLLNDDLLERFAADYTISAVSTPDQSGAVVIDGSGPNNQLLYTPDADFVGEETFTYTVIDKTGGVAVETVTVEVIHEESDRDFAELKVVITGVNDTPQLSGVVDGATTDKLSVKPFPAVLITDLDEWAGDLAKWDGEQAQNITVEYDEAYGTVVTPGMTRTGTGVYKMTGTPAEVTAALRAIVFTPYENFIDYIDPGSHALDFDLSIDDTYLLGQVSDTATIVITPIDDAPTLVSELADMTLPVNSQPRAQLLTPHFADVDDDVPGGQLTWTVTGNTDPSLFNSITVDLVKQLLVLDFATDQFGVADITVRATDRGLLFVETSFTVTVQGPHVLDLDGGETRPDRADKISSAFFNHRYRHSFRVTNDGPLPAEAFIVKLSDFGIDGLELIDAEFSSDEDGSPNDFSDDTRSSVGVTVLGGLVSEPPPFAIKYDLPLAAGESAVVHFEYKIGLDGFRTIQPLVEIEWARSSGTGSMMLIAVVDPEMGEYELTFETEAGHSYQLEYSSDLSTWIPWATPIPVNEFDTVVSVTDDGLNTDTHPSLVSTRFYRLVDITAP